MAIHDGATVTGNSTGGSPTGTVSFYQCGPTTTPTACTSTTDQVGSAVAVTAGAHDTSSANSSAFTPTALGYWCFGRRLPGSADDSISSEASTCSECVNVTQGTSTTTTVPANTTITLGQADTDVATVAGNAGGGRPDRLGGLLRVWSFPRPPRRAPRPPTRWAVPWT